jgi:hypothetical protein
MAPNIIKKIPGYFYFRDIFKYMIKRAGVIQHDTTGINFEFEKLVTLSEEFPDKTFYIIRHKPKSMVGLCAYFYSTLEHIIYADTCGFIPVVDMENYLITYSEKMPIHGTSNAWEYYFKQPTPYTLQEAYSAKNIILSPFDKDIMTNPYIATFNSPKAIALRNRYIAKYISCVPEVLEQVTKKGVLFNGKRNILGVMHHHSFGKAIFHPVVPEPDVFLNKVIELYAKWNMEYVFLSTIKEEVANSFKAVFKDKLLLIERERIDTNWNKYQVSLEYLIEIIMLSKCDAYISSLSHGSSFVMDLNNNQFRNHFVFDMGLILPDQNKLLLGYNKYFTPYPPPYAETVNKIIPNQLDFSQLAGYMSSRIKETAKSINISRNKKEGF